MHYWMMFLRAWDRVSIYMPVMVMAFFALATYWLVRNTPEPQQVAVAKAPVHDPDYWMKEFAIRNFDASGRLKNEVRGDLARHFPDSDTFEIERVRMRSWDAQGRLTHASADRALSNADSSEVQLLGHAVVVREGGPVAGGVLEPALEVRGEYLHADQRNERLRSDQPVQLTRGEDRLSADGLDYSHKDRILQLGGRVKGLLIPAAPARN